MQTEGQNYGVVRERDANQGVTSAQEEKTWSILAHLSIFLNLFTGFLGPVAALVIWMVYRDRSPRVAFHALQSMWYQIGWLVLLVMALLTIVPFIHASYAAYKLSRGADYRYPFVADLMEDR